MKPPSKAAVRRITKELRESLPLIRSRAPLLALLGRTLRCADELQRCRQAEAAYVIRWCCEQVFYENSSVSNDIKPAKLFGKPRLGGLPLNFLSEMLNRPERVTKK